MSYVKTDWVDNTTPLNAINLNNIEGGISNNEANKVDKITGKGLSSNDYDNAAKDEVAKVASKANQSALDATNTAVGVNASTIATHQSEVISQSITATRDMSLTGLQTITGLTNTPKRIDVRATTNDGGSLKNSIGSYEANGQSSTTIYKTSASAIVSGFTPNAAIGIAINETTSSIGTIQNITATTFDINWTKTGLPTGTATLQIVCHYH